MVYWDLNLKNILNESTGGRCVDFIGKLKKRGFSLLKQAKTLF